MTRPRLPGWLFQLRPLARSVASAGSPAEWVLGVVLSALVGLWLAGVSATVNAILQAGAILADTEELARSSLAAMFGPLGAWFVRGNVALQQWAASLLQPLGPAAPFVATAIPSLLLFGSGWLVVRLVERWSPI